MKRPQDRNLAHLIATGLLGWTRHGSEWRGADGEVVGEFSPSREIASARRVVRRMESLGFRYESRAAGEIAGNAAVLVSFFRERETYSALAESEPEAIVTAVARYLMGNVVGDSEAPKAVRQPTEADKK